MVCSLPRLAMALILSLCGPIVAQAQSDQIFRIFDIENDTGLDLGKGFDILTSTPRNQCVAVQGTVDHPELGFNNVTFKSYRVENSAQLDKALGLSASASIKYGVASGSGSASFSESSSVSSYSLTYVVEAFVQKKGKSISVQDLQERYRRLLSSGNPDNYRRFRLICGDGYVSEMPVGGSFRALIQIATKSRAESQEVSATVGGSYAGISGSAAFSNALKTVARTNEVRIWLLRRGGDGPVPITADDIATNAANLPTSAKQAPVPLQIVVFSYLGVLDDPSLPMATFGERAGQIEKLATLSQKARDQYGDAQYIFSHPDEFQGQPNDAIALSNEMSALTAFRALVNLRADQCISADGLCLIDDLVIPSPLARPARR